MRIDRCGRLRGVVYRRDRAIDRATAHRLDTRTVDDDDGVRLLRCHYYDCARASTTASTAPTTTQPPQPTTTTNPVTGVTQEQEDATLARADTAYLVTSNGTVDVTYSTADGGTEQANGARTPWSYDLGATTDSDFLYVLAQTNGTTVTCSIIRNRGHPDAHLAGPFLYRRLHHLTLPRRLRT